MKLQSVVAGQFYPKNPQKLLQQFKVFEQWAPKSIKGQAEALLLPHAGYEYSGTLAALGYRSLNQTPQLMVVIGPSHYLSFEGISVFSGAVAETPLGDLEVDQEAGHFLIDRSSYIADIPAAFAREHSVEVHFPIIKHYFPDARLVPVVMGQGMSTLVDPLVDALLELRKKKPFLLIASSDLSHYPTYETAVKADQDFLKAVLAVDEAQVDQTDKKTMAKKYPNYYCTHCGKEPVLTLLRYAKALGADKAQLLAYQNSGDVTGDHSRVVGYAAVVFCR